VGQIESGLTEVYYIRLPSQCEVHTPRCYQKDCRDDILDFLKCKDDILT